MDVFTSAAFGRMVAFMNLGARVRHLLVFVLMLGVGAIPVAANAAALESMTPVAMETMEPMADGMHCCPDDVPVMPDCQKSCPLLATCMTKCAPAAPMAAIIMSHRTLALSSVRPGDDAARAGPVSEPPARPPRS
ncbi:hypothetical protein GCM10008171_02090 [Methylopila jiangsuensis]|uniref:Uncharacterized protein n=1 Tax=Methylopila jiangsuensis TaxID=586230 RepID=A0A9W6JCF6_9HYPH|nr:hypothetical protein [Methylopila jiangsuensis]MDR6287375.1 hypothetical protein [Methylopila jiangsuensis]GLK74956.1 hypothetical protein GCM10008171_02090 [Methylopila jiangsuensis]